MSPLHDPGVWMIVALWACVHVTVTLLRKFGGKPKSSAAWWMAPAALLSLIFWGSAITPYTYPSNGRYALLSGFVCVACGVVLAVWLRNRKVAWAIGVAAFIVICILENWYSSVASSPLYMTSTGYWTNDDGDDAVTSPPEDLASSPIGSNASIAKAGYLDEPRFDWVGFAVRGPYTWNEPVPLWHTAITGLCLRNEEHFRLWVSAGPVRDAGSRVRLVRLDRYPLDIPSVQAPPADRPSIFQPSP